MFQLRDGSRACAVLLRTAFNTIAARLVDKRLVAIRHRVIDALRQVTHAAIIAHRSFADGKRSLRLRSHRARLRLAAKCAWLAASKVRPGQGARPPMRQ